MVLARRSHVMELVKEPCDYSAEKGLVRDSCGCRIAKGLVMEPCGYKPEEEEEEELARELSGCRTEKGLVMEPSGHGLVEELGTGSYRLRMCWERRRHWSLVAIEVWVLL